MGASIIGKEYPLCTIFSSEFDFEVPVYQRPYAWTEDEAEKLFSDLLEFYINKGNVSNDAYFLGSIVLIKQDKLPHSEIIDGQQRLTTLTILLAVIANHLSGENRIDFNTYVNEPGKKSQHIEPKPRIKIRPRDNDFFCKYVQGNNIDALLQLDTDNQDTEAKENIIRNARLFDEKLKENFTTEEEIFEFGSSLVSDCYIVVVSTPTQESAFRIFTVMNSRGMSLLPTDILKSELIGQIPPSEQLVYTEKWENIEVQLTRDGFLDIFSQIRMIKIKAKAKKAVLEEIHDGYFKDVNANIAMDFIDNVLEPYADIYYNLKNSKFTSSNKKETAEINEILGWLNRIDNSDWVAVAMVFMKRNESNPHLVNQFLHKLERLSVFMRMDSWDVTHRLMRYGKIIEEIEHIDDSCGACIELTNEEIDKFRNLLNSDIYKLISAKRNYLILRLDSFVSDGAAQYNYKVLTIEHVLPQNPEADSEWIKLWPDKDERSCWLNKIGNLIPLTRRMNSSAQNYDFKDKKEKYFKSKNGTASYALATQVLNYNEWTPNVVKARQKELLDVFIKNWDLKER